MRHENYDFSFQNGSFFIKILILYYLGIPCAVNGGAGCDQRTWSQDDHFNVSTHNNTWSSYASGYSFAQVEATRESITYTQYDSKTLDVVDSFQVTTGQRPSWEQVEVFLQF